MLREQAEEGLLELTETAIEAVRSALTEGDMITRLQAGKLVLGMLDLGGLAGNRDLLIYTFLLVSKW